MHQQLGSRSYQKNSGASSPGDVGTEGGSNIPAVARSISVGGSDATVPVPVFLSIMRKMRAVLGNGSDIKRGE